jgi:hypothetical protein
MHDTLSYHLIVLPRSLIETRTAKREEAFASHLEHGSVNSTVLIDDVDGIAV